MEKQVQAFFYDYRYYLFPEDVSTLSELKGRHHVRVRRLAEENCMAPDFIYESIREEELVIEDTDRLFPVSVNLYSSEEYDALLRKQVERVCPGCERFGGDSGNLDGHHREISLSGLCYERDGAEDKWNFSQCVSYFWYLAAGHAEELSHCIDSGDTKKLNRILNRELTHFCFPIRFYGGVEDGQYTLCLCPDFDHRPIALEIFAFLAFSGNTEGRPMSEAGWKIFPFRKRGVYRYDGKHKFKGKLFRILPSEISSRVTVLYYHPHAEELKEDTCRETLNDLHAALSALIGEDHVSAVALGYQFTAEKSDMVSLEELAEKLDALYSEEYGEESVFPAPILYSKEAVEGDLPFRDEISDGMMVCPDLSFLDRAALAEMPSWLSLLSFAYLYIPRPMNGIERAYDTITYYIADASELIPEPILLPEDDEYGGAEIGIADCGEAFILDFAVASERKFFRNLRCLAPLLMAYHAKLVFVNDEGMMVYDCGFEFTPQDGE